MAFMTYRSILKPCGYHRDNRTVACFLQNRFLTYLCTPTKTILQNIPAFFNICFYLFFLKYFIAIISTTAPAMGNSAVMSIPAFIPICSAVRDSLAPSVTASSLAPTVSTTIPISCGATIGTSAYTAKPSDVIRGITLTTFFTLKCFENIVKIKSTVS